MQSHFLISFGLWIIIIPFLGISSVSKNYLNIISGLFLLFFVLSPIVFNKIEVKQKVKKRKGKNTESNLVNIKNYSEVEDLPLEKDIEM